LGKICGVFFQAGSDLALRTRREVTEEQKRLLKKIGKVAAYTAVTGGAYVLASGL
jgi:hypothetical protein